MFIVSLTYICDLAEIDAHLEEHSAFLKEQYELGHFIVSGRKVPRTGGVILARVDSREMLCAILEKDPFKRENLATYDVQEFIPTMAAKELDYLVG